MTHISHISTLLYKDFLLEIRNKYMLGGIILYIASTIFLIYTSLNQQGALMDLEVKIWNILFWIILLFATVNATSKGFFKEKKGQKLYHYTLCSPKSIIISKILYHMFLMIFLSILAALIYSIILGNPVKQGWVFFITLVLGTSSYAILFTLISAIASSVSESTTLASILGFPLVLPITIYTMQLCRLSFVSSVDNTFWINIVSLLCFQLIMLILSLILFPYLWQD